MPYISYHAYMSKELYDKTIIEETEDMTHFFQDVKIIGWLMTQQVKAALVRLVETSVLEAPHMRLMS